MNHESEAHAIGTLIVLVPFLIWEIWYLIKLYRESKKLG